MAQPSSGIGNVTGNTGLVEMAMAYSRSRVLCAAARLGVADALGDKVRSVDHLAEDCQADTDALYRLLRALASIGITEETTPRHFRLTPFGKPLRRNDAQSAWPAVVFWADLLADEWSLLTDCIRKGKPASQVRDPNVPSRWSQDPEAASTFRAVMGTAPAEDYAPIAKAWDFSRANVVADLGGGGGSLILAVLELHRNLQGMLVDLEASVEAARARWAGEKVSSRASGGRSDPVCSCWGRCVHAQACSTRAPGCGRHYDSQELPQCNSGERYSVGHRVHSASGSLTGRPASRKPPDE